MSFIYSFLDYLYLALGLGFVIFFHELGHFLAAKWCGVKVEQFAVGFGPPIFSWRKGFGFRAGSSQQELDDAKKAETEGINKVDLSKFGETEYRLNWIPLGGYVKMLGQDDFRPDGASPDPRAYNNKPVRSRMLILSAGVIMNVILAAIAFAIVFNLGYPHPPAIVGSVVSQSPAMRATRADGTPIPLQSGDTILSFNGYDTVGDFSEVALYVALSKGGTSCPVKVQHRDGTIETLFVKPEIRQGDTTGLPAIGVAPPSQLKGPEIYADDPFDAEKMRQQALPDLAAVKPGDVITQINNVDVNPDEFWKLDSALEASQGRPIELTVKSPDGTITHPKISPQLGDTFSDVPMNFLGLIPRASVFEINDGSSAINKLKPGDDILSIEGAGTFVPNPSAQQARDALKKAGEKKAVVTFNVLSLCDSAPHLVKDLAVNYHLPASGGKYGLGVLLSLDDQHLVVADTLKDTASYEKIPNGATITQINGNVVNDWFQLRQIIADSKPDAELAITYQPTEPGSDAENVKIHLSAQDIDYAKMTNVTCNLALRNLPGTLKTSNPFTAMKWGAIKTRDTILQLYLQLQRLMTGSVGLNNAMGPVGLVHTGAQIARQGWSSLLWYLAMISANLAVVNFLPIPILPVDGGLFVMLMLEKIRGKPLSREFQNGVLVVGWLLILTVFVLVTYQDIARIVAY
jgi:regulator of sigma E protease